MGDDTYYKPFTVLVEGNIGSGKSTFLSYFSKFNYVTILKEPVHKWRNVKGQNLLELLYNDPERWGMAFQSYVQLTQMENHLNTSHQPIKLMERSIYSAQFCFAEHLHNSKKLHSLEYETLTQWFHFLTNSPTFPLKVDLIIYLRTKPETALQRVIARGREEESNIQLSFLQEIHQLHDNWLLDYAFPLPAPVIVIEADHDRDKMHLLYKDYEDAILGFYKNGTYRV